jgi:hypothetical protein
MNGMARRCRAPQSHVFRPGPAALARNTIIESTFEVGRRFRCTMRVDCGQLDPGAVIRPEPGEWHPCMPERLDEEELAGWRPAATPCISSPDGPWHAGWEIGVRRVSANSLYPDAEEVAIAGLMVKSWPTYGISVMHEAPSLKVANGG